jgi:hypothetical protein
MKKIEVVSRRVACVESYATQIREGRDGTAIRTLA